MFCNIPPFAIGRCYWTQWFVYNARKRGIPVIDATRAITAVESKHDYSHAVSTGYAARMGGIEYVKNKKLFKGCRYFTTVDSTHLFTESGLVRAPFKNRFISLRVRAGYFFYFLLKEDLYPYSLPVIIGYRWAINFLNTLKAAFSSFFALIRVKGRDSIFFLVNKTTRLFSKYRMNNFKIFNLLWHKMFRPILLRIHPDIIFAAFGDKEKFQLKLFKDMLDKGSIFVDIGANVGYYTLIAANLIGAGGRVYAFEPETENFKLLRENVKAFKFDNVVLEQKAVSNKTGTVKLYLSKESRSDHRIYDSGDDRKHIEVLATSLDDYFSSCDDKDIDIIKLDIQGAEMFAMRGMDNLLRNNNKLKIFTEFWPFGLEKMGHSPEEFLHAFIGYGFKIYNIDENRGLVEPINITKFINEFTSERQNYTNLLLSRDDLPEVVMRG